MTGTQIFYLVLALASLGFFALQFRRAFFPEMPKPGEGWFSSLDAGVALGVSAMFVWIAWAVFQQTASKVDEKSLVSSLVAQAVMGGMVAGCVALRGISLKDFFGWGRLPLGRQIAMGVYLMVGFFPMVLVLANALDHVSSDEQEVVRFFKETDSIQGRWLVAFLAIIVAPAVEELIFRGFLYRILREHFGKIAAMIFSSLLFAAIHGNLAMFLPLTLLAFGLTIGLELGGSLLVCMVMHAFFNGVCLLFMLLEKSP